jgi:hypothetical protein
MDELRFVAGLMLRIIHVVLMLLGFVYILHVGPDRVFSDPVYTVLVFLFLLSITDWRR